MWKVIQAAVLIYLTVCALWDIRKKQFPIWLLAAGTAGALAQILVQRDNTWYLCLAGGMVGVLLLLFGKMTKESIGYGDG